MDRAGAVSAYGLSMGAGRVALVGGKAILGVEAMIPFHDLVPCNLGDDGGSSD